MKKLIPLILIAFAPLFLKAQAYTPLNLDNSSFWVHDYYYYTGVGGSGKSASARIISYVEKDTVIQTRTYSKVKSYISKPFQNTVSTNGWGPWELVNFIREDVLAKKVFYYDIQNNRDSLYLDFNLQVNDTVNIHAYPKSTNHPFTYIVDSVQIKNQYTRPLKTTFWQHQDANNWETNELIEGVGMKFQFPFNVGGGEWNAPGFRCLCYTKKDTIEYLGSYDQWTLFPVDSCYKQAPYVFRPIATEDFQDETISSYVYGNTLIVNNINRQSITIKLVNLQGKVMFIDEKYENDIRIDLSAYPAGIYVYSLQTSKGIRNRKVLIQ